MSTRRGVKLVYERHIRRKQSRGRRPPGAASYTRMTASRSAMSTIMRMTMHHPLPFSSESRRNFRMRRRPSLNLPSVRSTPCSRSVSILSRAGNHIKIGNRCRRRREYALVVLVYLLPHEARLLRNRVQCSCYGVHRRVLRAHHHLYRRMRISPRNKICLEKE